MELFKIGGPNPDTNYLFMGAFTANAGVSRADYPQVTTLTEATSLSRL